MGRLELSIKTPRKGKFTINLRFKSEFDIRVSRIKVVKK